MVAVIYAPLIPAALTLISPALSLTHWQALFADPQLPQALLATLVSTTIAAVGALLIALLVIVALVAKATWGMASSHGRRAHIRCHFGQGHSA
ncbi:hypothetical protein ACUOFC_50455, partial [Escherichia sp. TWPC-MK]